MDDNIKMVVIGSALAGLGNITYLQLKDGSEYQKPEIKPLNKRGLFVIESTDNEGDICSRKAKLSEIEIAY